MILTREAITDIVVQSDETSPHYLPALVASHELLRARCADLEVMRVMERYGGGFVEILALLARRADEENLAKIKATWPEYWSKYEELVKGGR